VILHRIYLFLLVNPVAIKFLGLRGRTKKMSTPVKRRLIKDFKKMSTDPPLGISATPNDSDIMEWNAVIFG